MITIEYEGEDVYEDGDGEKHAYDGKYKNREVVCYKIETKDGKSIKEKVGTGKIVSISEKFEYEDNILGIMSGIIPEKIEVLLDNKKKIKVFKKEELDWVQLKVVLKEHLNSEQLLICSVINRGKPFIRITNAKFECPSCGTVISVLQIVEKFRHPTRCSCGRRGGFKTLSKTVIDGQDIVIIEKNTNSEYKAYILGKNIIDKLEAINNNDFVSITGEIIGEYLKNSTRGEFVINVTDIEVKKEDKLSFL